MAGRSKGTHRLVDVGGAGIAGYYKRMMQQFRLHLGTAIGTFALWSWFLTWPYGPVIYRLAPDITVGGILEILLALWTVPIVWGLAQGVVSGLRWLALEARGIAWIPRNDQIFRVIYARADGSIQYDASTRDQRLDQEVSFARYRRQMFVREGVEVVCWSVGYFLIPWAFFYLFELTGPDFHSFAVRWHFEPLVSWLYFYVLLVPKAVSLGLILFEMIVYVFGAAFIPGAAVRDALLTPKTLESMGDEMVHGSAGFVHPDDAASQMGS